MTTKPGDERRPNHLLGQTSPYLLQHLYNPVDWYPWGTEAIEKARAEDKPLFVSIGYAACHWCHVMERESFENRAVADLLNRNFVSVKVDREERPDVDEIYMNAVQLLTGQGGWPLTVFLTPALEPFVGGTYFPPEDRSGRMGFPRLLETILHAWRTRRGEISAAAAELTDQVRRAGEGLVGGGGEISFRVEAARAAAELASRFDERWGGFGNAPKFPPDTALALLLAEHARTGESVPARMVEKTLRGMALGGIYDHFGGGFARYSVDERWLVPHFEKMLYNQALMVPNYVDAWLLTREPLYRRVAERTLDFVRRELTHPDGGFWSSLDADSEGVEGRFYVWTPQEVRGALGDADAERICSTYGIDEAGNFEGRSIPNLPGGYDETLDRSLEPLRERLLAVRGERTRPATDDKILTAWNGLMITALCRGYQAFGRREDLESAVGAAVFIRQHLWRDERLLASWRDGRAWLGAYLDDYAFLARGLLDLYESSFDPVHLEWAERLAVIAIDLFEDRDVGGWFFTARDHERLVARNRSLHDGALPAGGAVMNELLLRLALHLDREEFRVVARRALSAAAGGVRRAPSAFASTLLAAGWATQGVPEIVVAGDPADDRTPALLGVVRGRYLPRRAVALARPGASAHSRLLEGKRSRDTSVAFVCRDYACQEPTADPGRLAELLDRAAWGE